ncbi:uncharacterized protein LOC111870243 isoform X2 [Cryptotermes secundus]|uniref:uncharacterized protein LOC111870243 isoform X2 n=1 Tax=Cryptotermes secundus TaxID=105785 RepID=UPI001454BA8A|nr:uncharacterized protein LOC111870243 isoform X2 [Cryptotermes secundus]
MRIKYLSHHDKAERGNENEAKCPAIISSCQLKEIRNCNSSACQHLLEEKLAHKFEENDLLHSHSDEFESEEGCTDQKMAGHQAQTSKQEDAVSLKMEVVSHNETDSESLYGPVESVFIKEEVLEDEGTDENVVDTLKNEIECKDEAESVVPHSTDEPVWTPKIKEKWWHCRNALREQSVVSLHNTATTLNDVDDPKSVHRPIESIYIKKENVQSDTDEEPTEATVKMESISDEEPDCIISHSTERVLAFKIKDRWHHCQNAWRPENMSDSQDTETSMSSEAVSASDHFAFESAYIKKEDINLESDDEDSSNSEASDNKVHVKKQRRKRRNPENHQPLHLEEVFSISKKCYWFHRRPHKNHTDAQSDPAHLDNAVYVKQEPLNKLDQHQAVFIINLSLLDRVIVWIHISNCVDVSNINNLCVSSCY